MPCLALALLAFALRPLPSLSGLDEGLAHVVDAIPARCERSAVERSSTHASHEPLLVRLHPSRWLEGRSALPLTSGLPDSATTLRLDDHGRIVEVTLQRRRGRLVFVEIGAVGRSSPVVTRWLPPCAGASRSR